MPQQQQELPHRRQRRQRYDQPIWLLLSVLLHSLFIGLVVLYVMVYHVEPALREKLEPEPVVNADRLEELTDIIRDRREDYLREEVAVLQEIMEQMEQVKQEKNTEFQEANKDQLVHAPQLALEHAEKALAAQKEALEKLEAAQEKEKQAPQANTQPEHAAAAAKQFDAEAALAEAVAQATVAPVPIPEAKAAQAEAQREQIEASKKEYEAIQAEKEAADATNNATKKAEAAENEAQQAASAEKKAAERKAAAEEAKKTVAEQEAKVAEAKSKQEEAKASVEAAKAQAAAAPASNSKEDRKAREDAKKEVSTAEKQAKNAADAAKRAESEMKREEAAAAKRESEAKKAEAEAAKTQADAANAKASAEKAAEQATAKDAESDAKLAESIAAQKSAIDKQTKAVAALAKAANESPDTQEAKAPEATDAAKPEDAQASSKASSKSLAEMDAAELYKTAVDAEKKITEDFKDVRATDMALVREVSLGQAYRMVDVPAPQRPEIDPKALNQAARSNKQFDETTKALETAQTEAENMVGLASSLLMQAKDMKRDGLAMNLEDARDRAAAETKAAHEVEGGKIADIADLMAGRTPDASKTADASATHSIPSAGGQPNSSPGGADSTGGSSAPPGVPPDLKNLNITTPGRNIVATGQKAADWVFVDSWYTIGPYPNPNRVNIHQQFTPESVIDLNATYRDGKNGQTLRWQFIQSPSVMVEPGNPEAYGIWYASTEIKMDKARDLWIAVGSDDRSDMWINGFKVWSSSDSLKAWNIAEGVRKVHFKEGVNKILYRVENGWGGMGFSLGIYLKEE